MCFSSNKNLFSSHGTCSLEMWLPFGKLSKEDASPKGIPDAILVY